MRRTPGSACGPFPDEEPSTLLGPEGSSIPYVPTPWETVSDVVRHVVWLPYPYTSCVVRFFAVGFFLAFPWPVSSLSTFRALFFSRRPGSPLGNDVLCVAVDSIFNTQNLSTRFLVHRLGPRLVSFLLPRVSGLDHFPVLTIL